MSLPGVYFTVAGYPVRLADWSANTSANIGHDQMRGRVSAAQIRSLPEPVMQGSVLRAYTAYGHVLWEGRLASSPKVLQDGTAVLAAQGHGYAVAKYAQRVPAIVGDIAAWVFSHIFPLNGVFDGSAESITLSDGTYANSSGKAKTSLGMTATTASAVAVAVWAPGSRFTRMRGDLRKGASAQVGRLVVYSADGPNIAASRRAEYATTSSTTWVAADITFAAPGDCVIVELQAASGTGTWDYSAGTQGNMRNVKLYADDCPRFPYSEDVARIIGDRLDLDTSYLGRVGAAPIANFDRAGGGAAALDELCSIDDLCWRVMEDRGAGPVLEFGPYRRVWEVSGRTGARWDLDPLELYNRVVLQYLTNARKLAQAEFHADPDPLADVGLTNELQVNLAGYHDTTDLPYQAAVRALRTGLEPRYRGRIQAGRAFDGDTGREATYEVQPGDLVRIRDFSASESLTLRIVDVQYGPGGITIGCDAPAIPMGALSAYAAGYKSNVFRPGGYTPPAQSDVPSTDNYVPPGGDTNANTDRREGLPSWWGPGNPGGPT